MVIYKITNLLNLKSYIGQTTQEVSIRWKQHCKKSSLSVIGKAIQKYSVENFKFEILDETAVDLWDLNNLEKHYIKMFNATYPSGYNMTSGGESGYNPWEYLSEEQKTEYKDSISSSLKQFYNNQKEIDKSAISKGAKFFEVLDIVTLKTIWAGYSSTQCSKELGLNQSMMSKYLSGRANSREYLFKVEGTLVKKRQYVPNYNSHGKNIFCLKNNKTYRTIKEAALDLNISVYALRNGINRKSEKYKDFIFK
jgi:group I intron endonuclease